MRKETGFIGLEKVMRNLNRESAKIKGGTMKGFIEVAILIRRSTEKDDPTVPVDWGNLRNSFFTTTGQGGASGAFKGPKAGEISVQHSAVKAKYKAEADRDPQPMMVLGFSANYATFVHENMEASFQRPGSGAKFLETSIESNKQKILSLIRDNAKIR
jgi:hypothetical protein